MTKRRVEAIFHRVGRRKDPTLVEQNLTDLRTPALRQSEPVEAALGTVVQGLLQIVETMRDAVEQLERALITQLEQHQLAPVLRSAPGSARCSPHGSSRRLATTPPGSPQPLD